MYKQDHAHHGIKYLGIEGNLADKEVDGVLLHIYLR